MSVGLSWAGFGSLGQGTWLSPWTSHEAAVVQLLEELGVAATSFLAELGRIGSGADLAAQAWDLPALRDRYDTFMVDTERLVDRLEDGPSAVVDLIALVHAWRRFPFVDPDLPSELLPTDWPAASAARRFATLRSALVGPATEWWRDTEASVAPAR
jgi:phenylacetic acid degradation operon negative regulatory protein